MDTQVTALLERLRDGDGSASEELIPLLYDELHRVAVRHLHRERPHHTLQPTELVSELYVKLFGGQAPQLADRAHFLALASQVMRRILVDHARTRNTSKRGGDAYKVTLNPAALGVAGDAGVQVLDLDLALDALAAEEPRLAKAVELHYFGGLTAEESAEVTGRSVHSARHDLRFAQAWLRRKLARA